MRLKILFKIVLSILSYSKTPKIILNKSLLKMPHHPNFKVRFRREFRVFRLLVKFMIPLSDNLLSLSKLKKDPPKEIYIDIFKLRSWSKVRDWRLLLKSETPVSVICAQLKEEKNFNYWKKNDLLSEIKIENLKRNQRFNVVAQSFDSFICYFIAS